MGYLVSFGNYWGIAILFSFISFISAWKLVNTLVRVYPAMKTAAVISFLFFPSSVFWSSGLIKESIAIAGLFAIVNILLVMRRKKRLGVMEGLIIVTGFWLLWNLKYYYAGVLLIAIGGIILLQFIIWIKPVKRRLTITLLYLVVLVIPAVLVTGLHPNFNGSRILEVVVYNYEAYRIISRPENLITYSHLEATPLSIIRNMPWALLSGIFQPFIWNTKSVFQLAAGIESFALFVLFIGMIKHRLKIAATSDFSILLGTITFIGLLAIFLALSTPNIGTLVRYRVGFYPFLMLLLIQANPWLRIPERFTLK